MGKPKVSKTVQAYIELIVVVLIWSLAPIAFNLDFIKGNYSTGMIVALRSLFATLALAVVNGKKLKKIDKEYIKIAIPSGLVLATAGICQMEGYRQGADPGVSAILENLALIVIPVLLYFWVKIKPTWTKIVAAVLCFIGSAIVALADSNGDLLSVGLGKWLAGAAGILYGVNFVVTGVYARKLDSGVFVFIQLIIQMLVAFLYTFLGEKLLLSEQNLFTFEIWPLLVLGALGVVAMGMCWTLRAHCLKNIPVMVASIIMPFSTVLTGVWSVAFGMEALTWNLLVGGIIVVGAIFIAEAKSEPKAQTEKESAETQEEEEEK